MKTQRGFGWVEVIIGLVIIGIIVAGVAFIYQSGKSAGIDQQKAVDQVQFDKIEQERAQQKAEAAALYQQTQADVIALQGERDALKTRLEKEREDNRKATDDRATKFAGMGLRFKAEGAGDRADRGGAKAAAADASGSPQASVVQLPGQITSDLRWLALDADRLRDDYAECYGYANKVR